MNQLLTPASRVAMASLYAKKYSIDVSLLCALIDHESSWNPWAVRYEPAFFEKYILPLMEKGAVHTQTEARSRATSWGLCQIMGQTARELGFTEAFLSQLCDPDFGVDFGCKKLLKCLNAHVDSIDAALEEYNGGSDPNYASSVKALIPQYLSI